MLIGTALELPCMLSADFTLEFCRSAITKPHPSRLQAGLSPFSELEILLQTGKNRQI